MQNNFVSQKGFTLLEILISTAIVAVISMISTSAYNGYIETAKISQAENQIKALSFLIDDYAQEYGEYPHSLADIGNDNLKDPWGNPYIYFNLHSDNRPDNNNDNEYGSHGGGSGGGSEHESESESDGSSGHDSEHDSESDSDGSSGHDSEHESESDSHESSGHDSEHDSESERGHNDDSHKDSEHINISSARKDGNLVPINTNYDLCSPGKDGKSKTTLRAKDSHDDIIYANDGDYIGIASGF